MGTSRHPIGFVETDRAYELRSSEPIPDGVRRIVRGRLDDADDQLARASGRELARSVHETRKSLKRLRACLRLSRGAVGEHGYRRESAVFRIAGQRLSDARDAQALIDTVDALERRFAEELAPALTSALRARLEHDRELALEPLRDDARTIAAVRGELEGARARTTQWTFDSDRFDALSVGLRRLYRRGRKRVRVAAKDPTAENLHELRKRVKDLWYASQILRAAGPNQMKKLSRRAKRVADLLGEDHDLAVLGDYVEVHAQALDDEAARDALLAVVERRRKLLQRKAIERAKRVYRRSPKRFVGSIERRWRKRVRHRPQPATG